MKTIVLALVLLLAACGVPANAQAPPTPVVPVHQKVQRIDLRQYDVQWCHQGKLSGTYVLFDCETYAGQSVIIAIYAGDGLAVTYPLLPEGTASP